MNTVYIATSLDGFIATTEGGLDWLNEFPNPDQDDFGYAEFIAGIDALVMGRKTFEKVLTFGAWSYKKPVFVLSNTLGQLPPGMEGKAEIVSGCLRQLTDRLSERGFKNLYIDGGLVIQSFLAEDLIDELIISRIPILLGDGIPLFGPLRESLEFHHHKTETFGNGIVKSHYTRNT
jgi:dihydrofolate reductase